MLRFYVHIVPVLLTKLESPLISNRMLRAPSRLGYDLGLFYVCVNSKVKDAAIPCTVHIVPVLLTKLESPLISST